MSDWLAAPATEEACVRMRAGVWRRIRRRSMARRALAGCLGIVFAVLWLVQPQLAPERLALSAPEAPKAPVWKPSAAPAAMRTVAAPRPPRTGVRTAKASPAERITIVTDDPDVLIILVGGGD